MAEKNCTFCGFVGSQTLENDLGDFKYQCLDVRKKRLEQLADIPVGGTKRKKKEAVDWEKVID